MIWSYSIRGLVKSPGAFQESPAPRRGRPCGNRCPRTPGPRPRTSPRAPAPTRSAHAGAVITADSAGASTKDHPQGLRPQHAAAHAGAVITAVLPGPHPQGLRPRACCPRRSRDHCGSAGASTKDHPQGLTPAPAAHAGAVTIGILPRGPGLPKPGTRGRKT